MDSSFHWSPLHIVNLGLALYSLILFMKTLVQFGLPNHPMRLTIYLVSFCLSLFFIGKAFTGADFIAPWMWLKYRPLPMIAGGLTLLLQVIICIGNFSLIQQKVISRLPLIGALLCLAFFPAKAEIFLGATLVAAALFLIVSVGKVRFQKRAFFKMLFFIVLYYALRWINVYWIFVGGELFLFPAIFYFYVFQQSIGVAALMDDHYREQEGLKV
jgi:hypothetical protein